MARRILAYTSLLYQELLRNEAPVLDAGRRLPLVLPVVLYNGETPWKATNRRAANRRTVSSEGPGNAARGTGSCLFHSDLQGRIEAPPEGSDRVGVEVSVRSTRVDRGIAPFVVQIGVAGMPRRKLL